MNTKLLLIRHGETEWSKDDRFTGISDVGLNTVGRNQAFALAHRLTFLSNSISAVFSSPMKRSMETAQIIADQLGLSVQVVSELKELNYGVWEGLKRKEILTRFIKEYELWANDPIACSPPEGETGQALVERALPAIERLIAGQEEKTFIVVAHKTINRLIICSLLGIPLKNYRYAIVQDTACLNVLSFSPDKRTSLIKLNDTSHYSNQLFMEERERVE